MAVLPDLKIVETDPTIIQTSVIEGYESLTGRKLAAADPVRLFLLSLANVIIQQRHLIDYSAKQTLLYYSEKDVLDHKGHAWRTPRLEAKKAKTTVRFNLSASPPVPVIIRKGIRVTTPEAKVFFQTLEEAVITEGYGDIPVECITEGSIGNGYLPGMISVLVDPVAYVQSIENITTSEGGSDREEDDAYRGRIQQAPERLSVAGPTGAYEYWAKSASPLIEDVRVDSTKPGEVDIRILLKDGGIPQEELINTVLKVVNDKSIRPLTDQVKVAAPEIVPYELAVNYYIPADVVNLSLTVSNIEKAIGDFVTWQKARIGRDINPSKLVADCIKAGAKRVEVTSPSFRELSETQVAIPSSTTITFGGVEND